MDSQLKRQIDIYVDGGLDRGQIDKLWTELVRDSQALAYLTSVVDTSEANDEGGEETVKTTRSKRAKCYWCLAAALTLIASAFFSFHMLPRTTEPVQPMTSIAFHYSRSADGFLGDNPTLKKAIKLAIQGNADKAVRTIDVAMSRIEDVHRNTRLLIQSGAILYNAGRYREALFRFERAAKIPGIDLLVREKAYWYLGNTYLQLGKLEAGNAAFQKTYELDGAYRRVAKKYLTALTER